PRAEEDSAQGVPQDFAGQPTGENRDLGAADDDRGPGAAGDDAVAGVVVHYDAVQHRAGPRVDLDAVAEVAGDGSAGNRTGRDIGGVSSLTDDEVGPGQDLHARGTRGAAAVAAGHCAGLIGSDVAPQQGESVEDAGAASRGDDSRPAEPIDREAVDLGP